MNGPETNSLVVTESDRADWLVRSALPRFLDLMMLTNEAAWFRALVPYQAHSPIEEAQGWERVTAMLDNATVGLAFARDDLLFSFQLLKGVVVPVHLQRAGPYAEYERRVRRACVVTNRRIVPTGLGKTSYRVLSLCHTVAMLAHEFHGKSGVPVEVEAAWADAWQSLTDRATLGTYERSDA